MAAFTSTPLATKLGVKPGVALTLLGAPRQFERRLGGVSKAIRIKRQARGVADVTMLFVRSQAELRRRLPVAQRTMADGGSLWLVWPKKVSRLSSDLSQQQVRAIGMAAGLVDYKICAVDETWSGLRFARRKPGRTPSGR